MVDRARPLLILSVVYPHFYCTGIPLHQCKPPLVLPCHDQCDKSAFLLAGILIPSTAGMVKSQYSVHN
jgi:hypothetical protein